MIIHSSCDPLLPITFPKTHAPETASLSLCCSPTPDSNLSFVSFTFLNRLFVCVSPFFSHGSLLSLTSSFCCVLPSFSFFFGDCLSKYIHSPPLPSILQLTNCFFFFFSCTANPKDVVGPCKISQAHIVALFTGVKQRWFSLLITKLSELPEALARPMPGGCPATPAKQLPPRAISIQSPVRLFRYPEHQNDRSHRSARLG